MKCIPNEPLFGEGRLAEKAVWDALRAQLPDDVVLAHSVQVRLGRAEHEIDILVLWPGVGLTAIEVKGGKISVDQGQWYQSDRHGKHKIESPIAQSQSAQHAFKGWVTDRIGSPLVSRFAYMAAFPYTNVPQDWEMAGVPRPLVLDHDDLTDCRERLRTAIETQAQGGSPLAAKFVQRIIPLLSGDLEPSSDPSLSADELEDLQEQLTERQKVLLDCSRSIPRARFVGGAGSGKTWLAVEKAKRLAKEGKRVGLFCYNRGLAEHLRRQVAGWRQAKPVYVGEFHDYAVSLGVPNGSGQSYFDEDMPALMRDLAAGLPPEQKLDAIVIDEAQDFAPLWWESLLACLRDPQEGEIYAFMDERQNVYGRWDSLSAGTALDPTAGLVTLHIDENLRNTKRIAQTFKGFAGKHFSPRGGDGLPVRLVPCATEDAIDVAGDCVDALIDEGWANNQIAFLTTKNRHSIHKEFENDPVGYWNAFHDDDGEFYGHVLGFKGLERSVVILCVNGFKDMSRAGELLYVGLSRARCLLVVVGDPDLIAEAGGPELERAMGRMQIWEPQPADASSMS
ncbi:NERD domain-containing protein [Arthrobacter zhangbolii]|uniref:NERD domain-containing protein n=1 Tax=Arthrobacter zhangbolii TaxID=2886936 RepID=A0A9X1M9B7_9MICC|nr:NERD domain-containing protein [Arthrobacter zhangbolii]MCC3273275.1 NERD domain-containing protein [Arthrobacter zhangbolii]UON92742.1 NERD domain-containing protein [Arthrobacter zhangbolii]